MVASGEGVGRWVDWEFGISRYKLVYIEWINNRVLLYSTGNYIQYPIIKHNGKGKQISEDNLKMSKLIMLLDKQAEHQSNVTFLAGGI